VGSNPTQSTIHLLIKQVFEKGFQANLTFFGAPETGHALISDCSDGTKVFSVLHHPGKAADQWMIVRKKGKCNAFWMSEGK
jgi:hypothetical protein